MFVSEANVSEEYSGNQPNNTIGPNNLFMLIFSIPIAVATPFIIVGNLLVIAAFYQNRCLRTPTNFVLTSLATVDLLSGIFASPLNIYVLDDIYRCQSQPYLATFPVSVLSVISFQHVVLLTLDRYIAVTRPLRYAALVTINRVVYCLVFVWLVTGIVFVLRTIVVYSTQTCYAEPYERGTVVLYWCLVVCGIVALAILIICNIIILKIAVKQFKSIAVQRAPGNNDNQYPEAQDGRGHLKAVRTISFIVGLFCICLMPFMILLFVPLTTEYSDVARAVIVGVSFLMSSFNSAMNPVIYGYRDLKFRQAVLVSLRSVRVLIKCISPT